MNTTNETTMIIEFPDHIMSFAPSVLNILRTRVKFNDYIVLSFSVFLFLSQYVAEKTGDMTVAIAVIRIFPQL